MKKQNLLLIVTCLFVILIVGASALYNYLDDKVQHESLVTENGNHNNAEDNTNANSGNDNSGNDNSERTPAPDFTVVDLDGTEYSLSDFQGKPVILNFWASWCGPCKSEMPDFEEMYQEYKDEIHFMFINLTDGFQETLEKASSYIQGQGYTFPVYYDTRLEAASAYNTSSIPATYFIDAEGNFVAWAQGAINKNIIQQGIEMIYDK